MDWFAGKQSWPELVGMRVQDAKTIIECENPNVKVVIASREMYRIPDLCCNIVWIYVDDAENGVVTIPPVVG